MKMTKARRIALLFNANKAFDRDIREGIAAHFGSPDARAFQWWQWAAHMPAKTNTRPAFLTWRPTIPSSSN
jgi:hypothetical protein